MVQRSRYLHQNLELSFREHRTSQDFAYYLREVPGCYFFVVAGNEEEGVVYPHHHPRFDIDEDALGVEALLATYVRYTAAS
jgi:metal-dependent amidase/aminoacylase/carboxypeptidase family protein